MSAEFLRSAARIAEWIASYRDRLPDLPVLPIVEPGEVADRLPRDPPERPEELEAVLRDLDEIIVPGLTHWNHPGFFAYFSSSSTDPGVLAEFVAAALNANAMLWRTAPAATELEQRMVDWVRRFVHLPDAFEGVLLDTASTSSFTALLGARQRAVPEVRTRGLAGRADLPAVTMYLSEQAHSSVEKAAIAAGLGLANVRRIPCDEAFRMDVESLEKTVREDRRAGRIPAMVCATIGTTSTTSVDPVGPVAELCRREDVWLHVDAAYAGPAASLEEMRPLFDGWERADSIVINPHKWMATPIDCSVFLYRDARPLREALEIATAYLHGNARTTNLMDVGLALGRRFRALKLWFLFRLHGVDGLRRMLRQHVEWARRFARQVDDDPRFERVAPVPFSTVCFRARPRNGRVEGGDGPSGGETSGGAAPENGGGLESDRLNRALLEAVNGRGPVFLSDTTLDGRVTLRFSVGSAHATEESVRKAFELLCEEYDGVAAVEVGTTKPGTRSEESR